MRHLAEVLLAATFAVAGCAIPVVPVTSPAGPVPTPLPDTATPVLVVETYGRALLAGDCRTAHSLAVETFGRGNGELCGDLRVLAFSIQGPPATPSDHEVVFAATIVTQGGDQSMPAGERTWFYDLQRQPDGTWRIAGGGSGP